MIKFEELREIPEAVKLGKLAVFACGLWLLGLVVLSNALFLMHTNAERLREADGVLNVATVVKSYPARSYASGKEPLTAVSEIVDSLGVKDRVSQMSSSASGLVVQIDRLYPEELTNLAEGLSKSGLSVSTAEIRAATGKEGRLITATFALEGVK